MSKISRLAVASSFVLSSVALALALRGAPSQHAYANPLFAGDLGPADALFLNTEAGKDPLRIAAKDGRISWGDRATNRVWSVASVDIDTVMKKILEGASYVEPRTAGATKRVVIPASGSSSIAPVSGSFITQSWFSPLPPSASGSDSL